MIFQTFLTFLFLFIKIVSFLVECILTETFFDFQTACYYLMVINQIRGSLTCFQTHI